MKIKMIKAGSYEIWADSAKDVKPVSIEDMARELDKLQNKIMGEPIKIFHDCPRLEKFENPYGDKKE